MASERVLAWTRDKEFERVGSEFTDMTDMLIVLTVDEAITVQTALKEARGKITPANADSVTAKIDAAFER